MSKNSKELSGLTTVLYTNFENVAKIKYKKEEKHFIQVIPKNEFDSNQVIREIKRRVDELSDDSSYNYITRREDNELHIYII